MKIDIGSYEKLAPSAEALALQTDSAQERPPGSRDLNRSEKTIARMSMMLIRAF
ncbi:hypothetical protein [Tessaracoccus caeni]|uniref:hypothetical protein n=1 Tax=Tessaracoccus caeni TaxID=3031239 RepID=UPI0023DAEA82|nr:hypothetical protein [Tessaracoccus caeni]MDF1487407.1 hypothetical protein [Tessaracoccus caeni]